MPSVCRGTLYQQRGTRNWSIKFYIDGKVRRESAGTDDREEALAYLRRRVQEAERAAFVETSLRPTFEQLHERLLEDYRFKRNRTDPT